MILKTPDIVPKLNIDHPLFLLAYYDTMQITTICYHVCNNSSRTEMPPMTYKALTLGSSVPKHASAEGPTVAGENLEQRRRALQINRKICLCV